MTKHASAIPDVFFHKAYMYVAVLAAAFLLLIAPRQAHAQQDALRVLAGRVLGADVGRDRWDDRGTSSRDRERWDRERRDQEKSCRKHRDDRRCDSGWQYGSRRGSDWCLDRDRDNRCDLSRGEDRGRGRGSWKDDDDRWTPPGRRGRR